MYRSLNTTDEICRFLRDYKYGSGFMGADEKSMTPAEAETIAETLELFTEFVRLFRKYNSDLEHCDLMIAYAALEEADKKIGRKVVDRS